MPLKKLVISKTIPEDEELIKTPLIISCDACYNDYETNEETITPIQHLDLEKNKQGLQMLLFVVLCILIIGAIIMILMFSIRKI